MASAHKDGVLEKMGRGVAIAEGERDSRRHEGFLPDIFRGEPHFGDMFPWPERAEDDTREEAQMIARIDAFLKTVPPAITMGDEEVTEKVIHGMARTGLFCLKVPKEHGGMGLSPSAATHVISHISIVAPALAIMVSADNSIGAKYPVLHYGTKEQIARYLPDLLRFPSAFCFTESTVGSDPGSMQTYAMRRYDTEDKSGAVAGYEINGEKWYATNSVWQGGKPLARFLAVIARIVDSPDELNGATKPVFGVFIVPNDSANGVHILQQTQFMGMKGICNGILKFDGAFVDTGALIDYRTKHARARNEGGFKIAQEALTAGRVSIASICAENAAEGVRLMQKWGRSRKQWGKPIGEHELIGSGMIATGAVHAFAMEAVTDYAATLLNNGKDARLPATTAKALVSTWAWRVMDNMMQVYGGRGYELASSLGKREAPNPVARMFVDLRPHGIFEGPNEILKLWVVREALDDLLKLSKVFLEGGQWVRKGHVAGGIALEYLRHCKSLAVPAGLSPAAARDMHFVEAHARKLARATIVLSGKYQTKMTVKQLTNNRLSWIAAELFAMSAAWSLALSGQSRCFWKTELARDAAALYCRIARRRIKANFVALWDNDDEALRAFDKKLLVE